MGSPLELQVPEPVAPSIVDRAWHEIVDEFEATEDALSRFRPGSEVHRLRLDGGHADRPSRRLVAALTAADRARRMTDGRFDPRVLLDLERLGSRPLGDVPTGAAPPVAPHAAAGSAERVVMRSGRSGPIDVRVPVDFGGVGKGLALRWAAGRVARILGRPFLLDAGGDLVARGTDDGEAVDGRTGWRVGIEDPMPDVERRQPAESPVVVIELPASGAAIATSSTKRARWIDPEGRPVHHLIDPRTGQPGGEGLASVTVLALDPAWAEVWSKSLFLAGNDSIAFLARRQALAAWWVATDGTIGMTPAARVRTLWVRGER